VYEHFVDSSPLERKFVNQLAFRDDISSFSSCLVGLKPTWSAAVGRSAGLVLGAICCPIYVSTGRYNLCRSSEEWMIAYGHLPRNCCQAA
jgi:hypothetical protein